MTDNWKSYVPLTYADLAKCHHLMKDFSVRGVGPDIVICTQEGLVLEFTDFRITGSFKTSCTDPKHITFFRPYDSKNSSFYIVESEDEAVILTRTKRLEVLRHLKNVRKTMISDFENTGFPQIGIWTEGTLDTDPPDIILDYNEDNRQQPGDSSIATILNGKYEELNMNIEEFQHKLELKKQYRAFASEIFDHPRDLPSPSELQLFQLVGEKHQEIDPGRHFKQDMTFQIAETWQRMHNGKWIIGIVICNTGKRNIQCVDLILSTSDEKLSYQTKLFIYWKETMAKTEERLSLMLRKGYQHTKSKAFPESDEDEESQSPSAIKRLKLQEKATALADWKQVDGLKCERKGVLIGIVDEPRFIDGSNAVLKALIAYKIEGKANVGYQMPVPSFCCSVGDFCQRSKAPFSSNESEADVLSVFVSSVTVSLPVDCSGHCITSIPKILQNDLNFEEYVSLGCLYNKGSSHAKLAGLLVHLDTIEEFHKYNLTVSARDMDQVYLLVHCLYRVFSPPIVLVRPPFPQLKERLDGSHRTHLHDEFDFVLQELKKWVLDTDNTRRITKLKSDVQVPHY